MFTSSQLHLPESEEVHAAAAERHKVSDVTINLFGFRESDLVRESDAALVESR